MIGTELGVVDPGVAAALVGAGLLAVLVLPPVAALLRAGAADSDAPACDATAPAGTIPVTGS